MAIYHWDVEQYSDQYHKLKLGIPTSSNFKKIITPSGAPSEQWQTYAHELIAERVLYRAYKAAADSGTSDSTLVHRAIADTYTSPEMARGMELEPEAALWYKEFGRRGVPSLIGFVTDDEGKVGCTPDRTVGDDGLLEIKIPKAGTQIGYIAQGTVASTYKPQLQGQLYVSERKWVDILAWHDVIRKHVVRVERDEAFIDKLAEEMDGFIRYCDVITERLFNGDEISPDDQEMLKKLRIEVRKGRRKSRPVSETLKASLKAALAHEEKQPPFDPETGEILETSQAEGVPAPERGKVSELLPAPPREAVETWICGGLPGKPCNEVFVSYASFGKHRQSTGHRAVPEPVPGQGKSPTKIAENIPETPKATEPSGIAGESTQETGPASASAEIVVPSTKKPVHYRARGVEVEDPFWAEAAKTGNYKLDIADFNIATRGRDQMMNKYETAPSGEAIDAFYAANLDAFNLMGRVRISSRIEVFKTLRRRRRELGVEG